MVDPSYPDGAGGGTSAGIDRIEHDKDAQAKKVEIRGLFPNTLGYKNVTTYDTGSDVGLAIWPAAGAQFEIIPLGTAGVVLYGVVKKGKISGASLTASYQQLTPSISILSASAYDFYFFNSCDKSILISLNGGSDDHFELDPYESFTFSYMIGAIYLTGSDNSSTPYNIDVMVKHNGSAPTSGSLRLTAVGSAGAFF